MQRGRQHRRRGYLRVKRPDRTREINSNCPALNKAKDEKCNILYWRWTSSLYPRSKETSGQEVVASKLDEELSKAARGAQEYPRNSSRSFALNPKFGHKAHFKLLNLIGRDFPLNSPYGYCLTKLRVPCKIFAGFKAKWRSVWRDYTLCISLYHQMGNRGVKPTYSNPSERIGNTLLLKGW